MFSESLFQYGFKMTSDAEIIRDTIQELFIDLWRTRKNKRKVEYVKTYLLKALRFKILKALKSNQQIVELDDTSMPPQVSRETEIILAEFYQSEIYNLRKIIANLPRRQREIIHLRFYQSFDNQQIATILDVNKQSVANLLIRALASLRKKYSKKVSA